jgi:hypothetical protein
LYDTTEDPLVDSWTGPPLILKKLHDLLPIGETLYPEFFNNFTTCTLPEIAAAGREQLLYWHLSDATTTTNHPAESILLWNNDDAFWFLHVAPREEQLIQSILDGNRIRYIDRFRLDYTEVQISFLELRLSSLEGGSGFQLVSAEGREYTFRWSSSVWETTLENPDNALINPLIYHLPPSAPTDPETLEFSEALIQRAQEQQQEPPLPPSSPPSPSADSIGGTENPPWNSRAPCWCSKEVCDCGYRPQTPPTPPSVVLWAPGQNHLPFRE